MEYIEFGSERSKVSKIVLGCMRIPELDVKGICDLLETARDVGINFLDIADCYSKGRAEELLGAALKQNSFFRDSFFIQSKCGIRKDKEPVIYDFSKEYILKCVDDSLRRLNTDHLDCLLLHRPDALMEVEEVGEAFNTLRESGKVLNFGVSNMNPMQMKLLRSGMDSPIVANQVQMSVCHTPMIDSGFNTNMSCDSAVMRDGGILEYCRLHRIVVQAWSVMQYGFFEGVFVGSPLYLKLNSVLDRIAGEYGVTPTAVAIAWVLRYPGLMQAVIGTTKAMRVIESSHAIDFKLTRHQWYEIYLAAGNELP
ncbi:MAG: aldo/keto reductase family oxidoreductase [Succinivibrio sp.]